MKKDILMNYLPKAIRIKEEIKELIKKGFFGKEGEIFMSVRQLAKFTGVSLVTAQRIMILLREDGIIENRKGKYIIKSNNQFPKNKDKRKHDKEFIGILVTNIANPFFSALVRKMEETASKLSIDLIIASSNYDIHREADALRMFIKNGVDGIIASPGLSEKSNTLYSHLSVPFVFIGRKLEEIKVDSIQADNFNAAKHVATHFINLGYKKFAYIGLSGLKNDARLTGFKFGIEEAGYTLDSKHIFGFKDVFYSKISANLLEFTKKLPKPVAVFCFHDTLAFLLLTACKQLKISVPEEIAIVGFDNLPFTSMTSTSLTTVGYSLEIMAELAIHRLITKIRTKSLKRDECTNILVETKLHIRESSLKTARDISHEIFLEDIIYQAS